MPTAQDIYYREYLGGMASRPRVVLIHGAGGSYLHWPAEIRRIAGENILAIDLPGHGRSVGGGEQTIAGYAETVINFLDSLEIDLVVLAGHSMGTAIALTLSLEYPDRVKGIILLGAGAKLRVHPEIIENSTSESTYPLAVSMVMENAFSSTAPQRLVDLAGERMSEIPASVLYGDFIACDNFDVMDRLDEINQPALVICGSDDRLTPLRYAEFLAEGITNARLEVIPNAGHMVMLEQPSRVAYLMKAFLDDIVH